jgi:hypothetical protein
MAKRRDPFKLPTPPPPAVNGTIPGNRLPGKHGLMIGELRVEGIVRQAPANPSAHTIAVVVGATKVAYFLHEHDVLADGYVSRITPDAVYFEQNYLSPEGKAATQEVIKHLGKTSEGLR